MPIVAMAEQAGLMALTREHVRVSGRCGVNVAVKIGCLAAGG